MLSSFDWLRRSCSGTELLSVLRYLTEDPEHFDNILRSLPEGGEPNPPPSALTAPCSRCWIYPRSSDSDYCPCCRIIRQRGKALGPRSRDALVVWGFVNWLPRQLRSEAGIQNAKVLGAYVHDANHFLLMIEGHQLQPWLQGLVIYHGADLKGHVQVFPTMGSRGRMTMGDLLCRVIQYENYFPMDMLRVRLYTKAHHVLRPHEMDREGLLTFEVAELLSLLEMAMVFRSVLRPDEQQLLYELLTMDDKSEEKETFYWGRLLGMLSQEGKDLLNAWGVRRWKHKRVKFFYELTNYVEFRTTY